MSRRNLCSSCVLSVVALMAALPAAGAETDSPITVSPGDGRTLSEVEQRCPTFSWGGHADTARWELVVYRLEDGDAVPGVVSPDDRPVLTVELPGTARAWTPALGQCLEPGGRYAWAVRAAGIGSLGKGATSSWSEPRLFKIVTAPSMAEVRDAMAVLSAYLGGEAIEVRTDSGATESREPTQTGEDFQPPIESNEEGVPTLGGTAAIRATQTAVSGDASGFVGETSSVDGAGGVFGNMAGGPDVVLDGSADTETDTVVSQSGIDRSSASSEGFDIGNSGAGDITLTVDGTPVLTTATETLGGLSCANGQLAKWNGGLSQWECGDDLDTLYTAGNQLSLIATQFNVLEGSGSGLDADLLDGLDSTDFLATGTDDWVNVTGDTMTGTLTLNPAAGNAITTSNDIELGTGSLLKAGTLFLHNQGSFNTGVGFGTLQNNTTAYAGTAVGTLALTSNTTGIGNTAVGTEALENNTEGAANSALGRGALRANTTGFSNTAVGGQALRLNTTGVKNTAVGYNTLRANTIGAANTSVGEGSMLDNTEGYRNTAVGYLALFNNTTAPWNTAVGAIALVENTIGERNIAVGGVALRDNTEGSRNVAIGIDSMQRNTLGNRNVAMGNEALFYNQASDITAVGNQSMKANTTGTGNTALGAFALYSNSTGYRNTAVGFEALRESTSFSNTASGYKALTSNTYGSSNTATGTLALTANTTGFLNTATGAYALNSNTIGIGNTATGAGALFYNDDGDDNTATGSNALRYNTSGGGNTAIGSYALNANITGSRNTASGANALASSTTAENNVAMGASALAFTSTGSGNTAVGSYAMNLNEGGASNAALGNRALRANSSGRANTALGASALYENTTGYANVGIGTSVLKSNTTGSFNVVIGAYTGAYVTGSSNIALNSSGVGGTSNTLRIGEATGTGTGYLDASYIQGIFGKTSTAGLAVYVNLSGKLGTTTSSKRFKEEIGSLDGFSEGLQALRPVQFRFTEEHAGQTDRPLEFGLIAEEVAEVFPDLVVYDDEGKPFTVRYHLLTPLLLNEIQRQQRVIAVMNRRLEAIEGKNHGP